MSLVRFGISTHLFHDQQLDLQHLREIAARRFASIEVFATRTHFDYHDRARIEQLAEWLQETGLALDSVHAPICASLIDGQWGETYSNAIADEARRRHTLAEAQAALAMAAVLPYRHLVVHLGVPDATRTSASDNSRDAARRSLDELHEMTARAGVMLALEVIPNALSRPETLVSLIEDELETTGVGICLDVGHAFMMGDLGEAIETCSGHLVTTHLHDNDGKVDDHRTPGEGGIDWPSAVMGLQKVGYEGTWMFEVANTSNAIAVLDKTAKACRRFESLLDLDFDASTDPAWP